MNPDREVWKLTERGEVVLVWLGVFAVMVALLGCAWLGQHWKQQRLDDCVGQGICEEQ